MPIYEFACHDCGNNFEELVTSSNEKLKCPKCNGHNLTKKFSVFGFSRSDAGSSSSAGSSCGSCRSHNCSTCR